MPNAFCFCFIFKILELFKFAQSFQAMLRHSLFFILRKHWKFKSLELNVHQTAHNLVELKIYSVFWSQTFLFFYRRKELESFCCSSFSAATRFLSLLKLFSFFYPCRFVADFWSRLPSFIKQIRKSTW